jgi:hypothetical protein
MQKYQQTRNDLLPYQQAGQQFTNQLSARMPELTANFNPTMDQLNNTPGYQFIKQQGLEAAQNGFASKGLGVSGAAMKGAADYATGLASNTLSLQQQIFSANQQNAYNKLMGGASLGENAAAQSGSIGSSYVNQATQAQMGGANASAAGQIGAANAWANGLTNAGNGYAQYTMYNNMLNGGGMPAINAQMPAPYISQPNMGVSVSDIPQYAPSAVSW